MTVDIVTFNGEYDLLEIRLNILNDVVDEFIIVEAPTTFSGKPKPLYYKAQEERYLPWAHKIKYYVIDENYTEEEIEQANTSPNTQGAAHWKREFLQKESIKKALTHLPDDAICFVGDVDEIWAPYMGEERGGLIKLKLRVYSYYLNNKSNEEFWGTIKCDYRVIKNNCLNHLRSRTDIRTSMLHGWHFTSMGGYEELRRKLSDSYTRESYWTEEVENDLEYNHDHLRDFLGRNFEYYESEIDLPQYIRDNKDKYADLFR
jgi:beta-1,4-mannosyl-glycoprotein beta-1,4-N-acetylglucosaminyltransferase